MKLELTEQEGQILINLINEGVKAKGLEVAEAAFFFFSKIKAAHESEKKTESSITEAAESTN